MNTECFDTNDMPTYRESADWQLFYTFEGELEFVSGKVFMDVGETVPLCFGELGDQEPL